MFLISKFHLIGIEDNFSFIIVDTNSEDFFSNKNQMEIEEELSNIEMNPLWNSKQKEEISYDFGSHYLELVNRM